MNREDFCNDGQQVLICSKHFDKLEQKIDDLGKQISDLYKNGLSSLDRRVAVAEEQHDRTAEHLGSFDQEQKAVRIAVTQHGVTLRLIAWVGGMLTATTVGLAAKAIAEALTK